MTTPNLRAEIEAAAKEYALIPGQDYLLERRRIDYIAGAVPFAIQALEMAIQICERHTDHEGHNVAHFAATEIRKFASELRAGLVDSPGQMCEHSGVMVPRNNKTKEKE